VVRPRGSVPIGSPRPTHHTIPGPEELPAPLQADHPAAVRPALAATAALPSIGGGAPATSQSDKIPATLKARAAGKATTGSSTRARPASSGSASAGDPAGGTSLTPAISSAQSTQSSFSTTASRHSPSAPAAFMNKRHTDKMDGYTVRTPYTRQLIRLNMKKTCPTRTGMEDSRPIFFCKRFS